MLQAKVNNDKLITLFQYSKEEIEKLRANYHFYCPACEQKVIVKAGTKMIPHFAHHSTASCQINEGGEGSYHEKGKLLLYQWLKKQGLDVTLERYFPTIKQRADLYIRIKLKQIAIEYQCAKIPIEEVLKRTRGYLQEGIQPIWILGANQFYRIGSHALKVDQFILHFLQQYNHNELPLLFFFDPRSNSFITAANLILTHSHRAIGNFTIRKLNSIKFMDIFNTPSFFSQFLLQEWKKVKYNFRIYNPKKLYGKTLLWYKWLYFKGLHKDYLPSEVYLPVQTQYQMNTPPWDWQSRICIEVIDPIPIGGTFSLQTCYHQLQKNISNIPFPLISNRKDPILEYLQLLCCLTLINQVSKNVFKKCKDIKYYSHIEDAIKGDEQFLKELLHIFKSKYEHDS
ncbi:competence protein CoiA [Ornithinibacillus sp. 179-J 7C1 HS]|uniref:competence protein CoiA n=1 Tax=Ornithinibacillus sp. 179-J 7C1 HS TaxID=3142384 RepID=UPI0039A0C6CB